MAQAAAIGAYGIESLAEQMMPGFPNLPDAFYACWQEWMRQYHAVSVCHDMFLDTKRYKTRLLTEDECVESIVRDLRHAARLGCKIMRVLVFVSPELMEKCLPHAERYDVKMGIEVHAPWHFDHPWIMRHVEMIQRTGTRHAGFVPDMGIFTQRLPRVMRDRALRNGATPAILDYVSQAYETGCCASTSSPKHAKWEATRSTWDLPRPAGTTSTHSPNGCGIHALYLPHPRQVLRDAR